MAFSNQYNLPLGLSVQKDLVQNYSGIQKFGLNTAVGTSFETIWDGNNTYTYPSSAGTATATSSDTSSDNTGTVEIQGLDSNYDLATETLTIGGSAGSTSFTRVFRAVMKTANTGTANVGTISITVSSTTVAQIRPDYGQTLMCVYTVPRKHNAYLMQVDIGSSKDLENEIRFITKEISNGNVWNTKSFITTRGGFMEKNYAVPVVIPEKTDIELIAKASATSAVSGGFELILEKIDQS
tara:strand:- start:123 stop:839 length:717 start_codon:yes stop_codon:yes gene_type:complete